jgi:hypothetical protein
LQVGLIPNTQIRSPMAQHASLSEQIKNTLASL